MSRARTLSVLAVVGMVGVAFAWQRSLQGERNAQALALAELRLETERLRAAVVQLKGAPQAAATTAAPSTDSVSPELIERVQAAVARSQAQQTGAPVATPPTPAQEREDVLQYASYLDDHLAGSRRPQDGTATTLRSKIAAVLGEGSALLGLECGEDLCRVETRHKDLQTYRLFQGRAFQEQEQRVWSGPATFVVLEEPDDSGRPLVAASYLGRGQALPSYEPSN